MPPLNDLDRLARRQHSLVTTAQLRSTGLSDKQIRVRIERGDLIRVRTNVLRMRGGPITRRQAWLAAVLAAEVPCVLGHGSAAALWGFRGFDDASDDAIHLLTTGCRPHLHGVRAHHTLFLPDHHITRVDSIPVTNAARTLIDACGLVSPIRLERAIDDALRHKSLHLPKLVRAVEEVPRSGRRRSRPIRLALAARVPGYDPGGSAEELDVMEVLKRTGLPLPSQQVRVRLEGHEFVLDYAWKGSMHCLEHLGKHWHAMKSDFDRDYERFRILQRGGWTPWPLTATTTANELRAIQTIATAALLAA